MVGDYMIIESECVGVNIYPSNKISGYYIFLTDENGNEFKLHLPSKMIRKLGRDIREHEPDLDSCYYVVYCPYVSDECTTGKQRTCTVLSTDSEKTMVKTE